MTVVLPTRTSSCSKPIRWWLSRRRMATVTGTRSRLLDDRYGTGAGSRCFLLWATAQPCGARHAALDMRRALDTVRVGLTLRS